MVSIENVFEIAGCDRNPASSIQRLRSVSAVAAESVGVDKSNQETDGAGEIETTLFRSCAPIAVIGDYQPVCDRCHSQRLRFAGIE